MNREDDQPLWEVLGRGRQPQVSPFFARNVLRKIRQGPRWAGALKSWLNPGKLIPASVAAIALVIGLILTQHAPLPDQTGSDLDPVLAKIDAQDFEVVADLDDLLASDDNNDLWDDNSSL